MSQRQIQYKALEIIRTRMGSTDKVGDLEVGGMLATTPKRPSLIPRKEGISRTMALINFLKGMIGPGCFSLPIAFKEAGLWGGFSLVLIIGLFTARCMVKLVQCSQYLATLEKECESLDYGHMCAKSFQHGTKKLQKFKNTAHFFVNFCLMLLQLGVCSIFFIFVVDNTKQAVEFIYPTHVLKKWTYMLILVVPFLLISLVRSIRVMSWVSFVGNIFMISSVIMIFGQLIIADHEIKSLPSITNFSGITLAAGSVIYSFEGQAMVLPLENRLKYPRQMLGMAGVLPVGLSIVTFIYVSSGFLGYITYGNSVQGAITLNMPDNAMNFAVKVLLILVIYTGFLIQLYPMVTSIMPVLERRFKEGHRLIEYGLRMLLVLLAICLAAAIPNLENIIPLVGVSAGMLLALVIPSAVHTNTFLPLLVAENTNRWRILIFLCENVFFFVLGLFFLVAGLQANIESLVTSSSN